MRLNTFRWRSWILAIGLFAAGIATVLLGWVVAAVMLWIAGCFVAVQPFLEPRVRMPRELDVQACWAHVELDARRGELIVTRLEIWFQPQSRFRISPSARRFKRSSILGVEALPEGVRIEYLDSREVRRAATVRMLDDPERFAALLGFGIPLAGSAN